MHCTHISWSSNLIYYVLTSYYGIILHKHFPCLIVFYYKPSKYYILGYKYCSLLNKDSQMFYPYFSFLVLLIVFYRVNICLFNFACCTICLYLSPEFFNKIVVFISILFFTWSKRIKIFSPRNSPVWTVWFLVKHVQGFFRLLSSNFSFPLLCDRTHIFLCLG